jgi:polyphenol oxidase
MTTSTFRRSSSSPPAAWEHTTRTGTVRVVVSTRLHGDFHLERVPEADLRRRRRELVDLPWTMLDEQHGTEVVEVHAPGAGDGHTGDVLVTSLPSTVLGVWAGDCAPVVLVSDRATVAVHAGWRGLAAGVIDVAVTALGPTTSARAFLGPCIGPCCYEFDPADLVSVAGGVGLSEQELTATTTWGTPSLDVPAAVSGALARHGIPLDRSAECTGCDHRYFSHRCRNDLERHVVAVWKDLS